MTKSDQQPSEEMADTLQSTGDNALRRAVCALLVVTSMATMVGRICSVKSQKGDKPFLSANDRSRWCTIRALVENGTYAIDEVIEDRSWDTIDKVKHPDKEGRERAYSSKPTLLPTILAVQYWIVRTITGATLKSEPFYVVRVMLCITNVVPLLIYFWLLARMVTKWAQSDWTFSFVMTVATWGTFLTAFSITLNNHLPAAISVLIAVHCVLGMWYEGRRQWHRFALCGFFGALGAANELPALSLLAILMAVSFICSVRQTLLGFLPATLLVAAGFFGTNYAAHGTLELAYMQRHVDGGWYDYEGSYWQSDKKSAIDQGELSQGRYATHVLVGHHGILSLSPIWLISVIGLGCWCFGRNQRMPALATAIAGLTVVSLIFYIGMRPPEDRNYGGMAIGFRWMFWFIPLWTLALVPAAEVIGQRPWLKILAMLLLAVSVFSASYSPLNPWSHPWFYEYWQAMRWGGL